MRVPLPSSLALKQVLLPVKRRAAGDPVGDEGPAPCAATPEEVLRRDCPAGVYRQPGDRGHDQLGERDRSIQTEDLPGSSQSNSSYPFLSVTERCRERQRACRLSIQTLVPDRPGVAHMGSTT